MASQAVCQEHPQIRLPHPSLDNHPFPPDISETIFLTTGIMPLSLKWVLSTSYVPGIQGEAGDNTFQ